MAERLENYRCPPDCPERSRDCHPGCKRYARYRQILESTYKVSRQDREIMAHFARARDNFKREQGY